MVDIGFGALIREFDERIGRIPTTILLVLIFLAVLAVCLNTIYTVLVVPMLPAWTILADAFRDVPPPTFSRVALSVVMGLGGAIVWLALLVLAVRLTVRVRRRYERRKVEKSGD